MVPMPAAIPEVDAHEDRAGQQFLHCQVDDMGIGNNGVGNLGGGRNEHLIGIKVIGIELRAAQRRQSASAGRAQRCRRAMMRT